MSNFQKASNLSVKKIINDQDLNKQSNYRLSQTGKEVLRKDVSLSQPKNSLNRYLGLNINDIQNKKTITETYLKPHQNHIYTIEEAEPPRDFSSEYHPLPNDVDFKRIVLNVMNALTILHKDSEWIDQSNNSNNNNNNIKKKSRYEKWLSYLQMQENLAVSSDCFWYIISKYFKGQAYSEIQNNLLNRISKNYVNYYISIEDGIEKNEFFKFYFDILSQTVFYSIFNAFPKSRHKFNDELKKNLIAEFSYQFTGITITNYHRYIKEWSLDLGSGNVFKMNQEVAEQNQQDNKAQQQINQIKQEKEQAQNKNQTKLMMRYSPIMERYLTNYKYKTINFQKGFCMRFTYYDQNQIQQKDKFANYMKKAKFIYEKMKLMQKHSLAKKQEIDLEIRQINQEASQHQRRLEKRKQEELERGAHEYANYLVSMLNSGITVATLGITNQNN